jgi:hypothetical protein
MQIETILDPTTLDLLTKSELNEQTEIAKKYPRNNKKVIKAILEAATLSESIAASCYYTKWIGKDKMGFNQYADGRSVRFAEIVCCHYGNIKAGSRVISMDSRFITCIGYCIDLETNVSIQVESKVKLHDEIGRKLTDSALSILIQGANSLAFRNAVFKVIPNTIITPELEEKIKDCAKGKTEDLKKRISETFNYFIGNGVEEKSIFEYLKVTAIKDIDKNKLFRLTSLKTSIDNGEMTIDEVKDMTKVYTPSALQISEDEPKITIEKQRP